MSNEQRKEDFQKIIEERHNQYEEVINQVSGKVSEIFPDPKQASMVIDLYSIIFKLTMDLDELNHNAIYQSSYIDGFFSLLVGKDKLLQEEDYQREVAVAYNKSLDVIKHMEEEYNKE